LGPGAVGAADLPAVRSRAAPTDAVIFDADGQGAESMEHFIDMCDKAEEDESKLLALVLLGPRQGDLQEKLPAGHKLIVLSKPLKMKEVQESIHRLLPAHPAHEASAPRSRGRAENRGHH
jgi:hypothetical protein